MIRQAPTLDSRVRGTRVTHAKVANPPTLLTSPTQEELRRAPAAGGGREIFDVAPRLRPRRGSGRAGCFGSSGLDRLTRDGQPYRGTVLSIQRRRSQDAQGLRVGVTELVLAEGLDRERGEVRFKS